MLCVRNELPPLLTNGAVRPRDIGHMPSLRNLFKLAVMMWFATYMNAAEAFAVPPSDTDLQLGAVRVPSHGM